jgi:hypothetical protein
MIVRVEIDGAVDDVCVYSKNLRLPALHHALTKGPLAIYLSFGSLAAPRPALILLQTRWIYRAFRRFGRILSRVVYLIRRTSRMKSC